jgi:uncharacterized protein YbbK (DUF523 family)
MALYQVGESMERVLVSACLLGQKVRYDGEGKLCNDAVLQRWRASGRVVAFCPEVAGGLSTPRPPAEISNGRGGRAVLNREALVIEIGGRDVSAQFIAGAAAALQRASELGIRVAVLKEGSPSCGSGYIYDGSFAGLTVRAQGVTAALLIQNGVFVFSELQLSEADEKLRQLEASGDA